jgi:hypothetical protein
LHPVSSACEHPVTAATRHPVRSAANHARNGYLVSRSKQRQKQAPAIILNGGPATETSPLERINRQSRIQTVDGVFVPGRATGRGATDPELMIGRSDPRLLFVEHQHVVEFLTLR